MGGPLKSQTPGAILLVDDDPALLELMQAELAHEGHHVIPRRNVESAWAAFTEEAVDAVITDISLDTSNGLDLARRIAANRDDIPIVVITAFGSLDTAGEALRAGAYDFLSKPFDMEQLAIVAQRAVEHRRLTGELGRLRRAVRDEARFGPIIGQSPAIRRACDLIARVARTDATVLITGESGTGKELAARAVHDSGDRRDGPFVPVNCAAMPGTLLESELFGHVRGAFTGAGADKPGLFAQADGGTLFLDEVGELDADVQAKLLRALQERKVRPVGGTAEVPFDARIVSATNRDLEAEIATGGFREDLYYRLAVVPIELPPLRVREGDVLLLARHFLARFAERYGLPMERFTAEAAARLTAHDWPGNVRELRNCIERGVALSRGPQFGLDDLPRRISGLAPRTLSTRLERPEDVEPLADIEKRYILQALDAFEGRKAATADALGIDRKTLYRRLERYAEESADG